jgi:abortive infection bacteriophage resistance protein
MDVKKHLTIDEQIELLKIRGCIIEDEELAKNILLDINYYRLTSYFLSFKESEDKYSKGTSFNKVYRNYLFDRKLRNMLSYVIEHIEVAIKTRIAYYHSLKYGPLGYLDSNNYNNKFDENILQTNLNKYIKRNEKNPIVIHHMTKYEGKFPLWVIIEFFDFSDASKMYSQLDTKLQKEIARTFNSNSTCLSSWLYCLTHLRNCCAHYARIYNTIMISMPVTPKNYK